MKFVSLESIADIQLGKMLSPPAKSGRTPFPYLRNQNVQWNRFDLADLATMDFSKRERGKFNLQAGDLLICEGGEPGRCAVWQGQLENCYYQKALHRLRPYADVANSEFLAFWIRFQALAGAFEDQNAKTTIAHLPLVRLLKLQVPDVGLEKQRQIAARLKAQLAEVDKARQAAEAQLRDTDALVAAIQRGVEKELFSKLEIRPFGSYVKSYRNGFGKRPKEGERGPIVLRIADVSSGFISIANPRHGEVSDKEAETYKLEKGDLLFIRVNGAKEIVGKCCVVDDRVPEGTIFNDHLIRVHVTDELNPDFARLCVSLPRARQLIEKVASTSAGQLTINQQLLDLLEIPVYSVGEQKEAVNKLQTQLDQLAVLREATSTTINDINLLPRKILARAFEG